MRKISQQQARVMNTQSKDGPVHKFYLIKEHGSRLKASGYEPQKMSCAELREAIAKLEKQSAPILSYNV